LYTLLLLKKFFSIHDCKYDLRDVCKFTVQKAKKGIVGVQSWNNIKMDTRMVNSFMVFKRIIYKTICEGYRCDGNVCISKMYVCIYIHIYMYIIFYFLYYFSLFFINFLIYWIIII